MSEVILIRPGCTDFDEQNRIQGSLELPLNSRGEQQVDELIARLRSVPMEVIYTAPTDPALSTAEAIGSELGVTIKQLEGLRNLDQGLWEGLQVQDLRRQYPKVYKQWQESPETVCPPEGESISSALDRVRKTLRKPIKRGSHFAVVASEPVASLVRCVIQDVKPQTLAPCNHADSTDHVEFLNCEEVASNGRDDLQKAGDTSRKAVVPSTSHDSQSPAAGPSELTPDGEKQPVDSSEAIEQLVQRDRSHTNGKGAK